MKSPITTMLAFPLLAGCTYQSVGLDQDALAQAAIASMNRFVDANTYADTQTGMTNTMPTSGNASYTGGAYLDLVESGGTSGTMVFGAFKLDAAFSATGGDITGGLSDLMAADLDAAQYMKVSDAIVGNDATALEAAFFDSANDNALTALASKFNNPIGMEIQGATITGSEINGRLVGEVEGGDLDIAVDDPVFGFFKGPDANVVRMTGTNFGSVELMVNGRTQNAYFDAYGQKD